MNQTRYSIEPGLAEGELEVSLENDTPGFSCYLARIDRSEWEERPDRFGWFLHGGLNTLEVRSRNTAGVYGIVSSVALAV